MTALSPEEVAAALERVGDRKLAQSVRLRGIGTDYYQNARFLDVELPDLDSGRRVEAAAYVPDSRGCSSGFSLRLLPLKETGWRWYGPQPISTTAMHKTLPAQKQLLRLLSLVCAQIGGGRIISFPVLMIWQQARNRDGRRLWRMWPANIPYIRPDPAETLRNWTYITDLPMIDSGNPMSMISHQDSELRRLIGCISRTFEPVQAYYIDEPRLPEYRGLVVHCRRARPWYSPLGGVVIDWHDVLDAAFARWPGYDILSELV
jgi:hypothetical protein